MDPELLEDEHRSIYESGPTPAMLEKLAQEEEKFGGRLPWTGEFPGREACRELGLYCYWGDRETGVPIEFQPLERPGRWVPCDKDHPKASEDLNQLATFAKWDPKLRRWVDSRN